MTFVLHLSSQPVPPEELRDLGATAAPAFGREAQPTFKISTFVATGSVGKVQFFSFRPPSLLQMNYAALALKADRMKAMVANQTKKGKVAKNDPCPCGSGRKYKKGHGKAPTDIYTPGFISRDSSFL